MATTTPIPSLIMCYKNRILCSIVQIRTEEQPLTFLTQSWLKNGYRITYNNYVQNEQEIKEFNEMFAIFRITERNSISNNSSDIQSERLQTDQCKIYSLNSSLKIGQILSTNSDSKDVNLRVEVTVRRDTRIQENRDDEIVQLGKLSKSSMDKTSETIIVWNTKLWPGHDLVMDFKYKTRQQESIDIPAFLRHTRQHGS
jgi:hypothetical protein